MNSNQNGGVTFNILLVLLVMVIFVLAYILVRGDSSRIGRTIGADTPSIDTHAPRPAGKPRTITTTGAAFDDGLGRAGASTQYPLDEFGAGLAAVDVFNRDINNDGRNDRITRRRIENGTAHFIYEYTIELNTPTGFIDITPDDFRTIEGAQCALQKLRFIFTPAFSVIKISRPWRDTWNTPTQATRDTFSILQNQIHHIDRQQMTSVCDVAELF